MVEDGDFHDLAGIGNALLGAEFNQVEKMRERLKTPEGLVWAVCDLRAE